jgi:glycosyltransferase involved in cell wall biosynthesis
MSHKSPFDPSTVFVIIPSFNEGPVLAGTVAPLIDHGYSVVIVDDGSSDQTPSICQALPVHYLRHPVNLGQGAALETGMRYGVSRGAKFLVHFDADGQHDHGSIRDFVHRLLDGHADVVLGSRFLKDEHARLVPPFRRFLLRVGIFVSWLFSGVWLSDTHNGFRALTADAARRIRLQENGFAHATEILAAIKREKLRYIELPVAINYSEYSLRKGQRSSNAILIALDLVLRKFVR